MEHIVELNSREREALIKWLQRPNGAHGNQRRLTFEAVAGGGILVRTKPFEERDVHLKKGPVDE